MTGDQHAAKAKDGIDSDDIDTRDMLEVHKTLRRELGLGRDHVRAAAEGDRARAATVAAHLELSITFLDLHHTEEDLQLWPKLLARAPAAIALVVELMEAQHAGIHAARDAVMAALAPWTASGSAASRDGLAAALDRLCALLAEHLAIEEEQILPVVARHLTAPEWARIGEDAFAKAPKKALPLAFGMLMYQGEPDVVAAMLANAPLPARLLVPLLAPRIYAHYARKVHGTATP